MTREANSHSVTDALESHIDALSAEVQRRGSRCEARRLASLPGRRQTDRWLSPIRPVIARLGRSARAASAFCRSHGAHSRVRTRQHLA